MYLLCLDESGVHSLNNTRIIREDSNFFVLAGIMVEEKNYQEIRQKFKDFKKEIFPSEWQNKPIHAVELHNLQFNSKSEYHSFLTPIQARKILLDCYKFISKLPIEGIAIIIDNYELCEKYIIPENPYVLAYKFFLEKFQRIIEKRGDGNTIGLINVSESHQNIADRLEEIHQKILLEGSSYVKDYKNVLPGVKIIPTREFYLFEIADLVCYAYSRSYRDWLCKHLGKKPLEPDYLEIIKDICTAKIGKYKIDFDGKGEINVKVFPRPRFIENQQKGDVNHPPSA